MTKADPNPVELVASVPISHAERVEPVDDRPALGSWWWVDSSRVRGEGDDDDDFVYGHANYRFDEPGRRWLACVVLVGSNFIDLEGREWNRRIHADRFRELCKPEPDAHAYSQTKIAFHQANVRGIMGEIQALCRQLGVQPRDALGAGAGAGEPEESNTALARVHDVGNVKRHQKALIKAKKTTLPDLYKQVEKQHELMVAWMKIEMMPAKAELERARGVVGLIDAKISLVELYAGLVEEIVQVRDGKPAVMEERVHLIQRRHYMDEECLAQYEAGGMSYEHVTQFDEWLGRPENLNRLFPWPRTIVAFRIRRYDRREDSNTIESFIRLLFENQHNKQTYLYIRNGEQLYRLDTAIEFPERLFPHKEDSELLSDRERLWVHRDGGTGSGLVRTERWIDDQRRTHALRVAYAKRKHDLWKKAGSPEGLWLCEAADGELFQFEAHVVWWSSCQDYMAMRKIAKAQWKGEKLAPGDPYPVDGEPDGVEYLNDPTKPYTPLVAESVSYDDVMKKIRDVGNSHNRIAIIIAGLLDRSTCLHPHPPWKLFQPGGMAALELVYDESRALTDGPEIDFGTYREQLNKSIRPGAYTIGQYRIWCEEMARRWGADFRRTMPAGYGNNGPAKVAQVVAVRRNGYCVFEWHRERVKGAWVSDPDRPGYRKYDRTPIKVRWQCHRDKLTCVSAYTPGDFRMFFSDPRTRANYIKWAPILLSAENWHKQRDVAAQKVARSKPKGTRAKGNGKGTGTAGYRGADTVDASPATGGLAAFAARVEAEAKAFRNGQDADEYAHPFEGDRGFDDSLIEANYTHDNSDTGEIE